MKIVISFFLQPKEEEWGADEHLLHVDNVPTMIMAVNSGDKIIRIAIAMHLAVDSAVEEINAGSAAVEVIVLEIIRAHWIEADPVTITDLQIVMHTAIMSGHLV